MNNFLYNDKHFNDVIELTDYLEFYEKDDIPNDFIIEIEFYDEKTIFNFDRTQLIDLAYIHLESISKNNPNPDMMEDVDDVFDKLKFALKVGYSEFEKFLPTVYVPNGNTEILTKNDLITNW